MAVKPEEAEVGKWVRVARPLREGDFDQRQGEIIGVRGGNAHHLVFDVMLEDGTTHLFWHHELEELKGEHTR